MADRLLYIPIVIHKITPYADQNTQLNEQTNQNSIQSPKLLSQRIRKRNFKLWGIV